MKKFDPSIPRKQFWTDKIPNRHRCPYCRSKLEREYQHYMVAVEVDNERQAYVVGHDLGAFCLQCPIVVFDTKEIAGRIAEVMELGKNESIAFAVLGIIDVDAIPEDKRDIPIGGDDNPIPLVNFVDTIEKAAPTQKEGKRLSGNQRRRLRKNQEKSG
jgi:hypothetical protein